MKSRATKAEREAKRLRRWERAGRACHGYLDPEVRDPRVIPPLPIKT
jgi:hypothetical protein